jgi:flagellar biosynthesis component FlhA
MKTLLTLLVFGSFSFALAMETQDSTQNQNREQKQIQNQEQNQQKNQGDENQIKDINRIHSGDQFSGKNGNKKGKDVFIDKDGDGIADTRAGGMSLNKIRKRTRSGQGSGGQGGNGPGGNGGGK